MPAAPGPGSDYRLGRRLGKEDHIVIWVKPARPEWMDEATYQSFSDDNGCADRADSRGDPGFRTRVLDLVTTLLDADVYTKKDLADLYRRRWEAELHLRSIKVVLGLDVLRCKTPEMVRKELWMGLLGYNVIRASMVAAAKAHGRRAASGEFQGGVADLAGVRDGVAGGDAGATALAMGDHAGVDRQG